MRQKQWLAITLGCMAHCRVPGTSTIVCVVPGDWMTGAHYPARVGFFVHGQQDLYSTARVGGKVVPLVGTYPEGWQHTGRGVSRVNHVNRCLHNSGVSMDTVKVGAHEAAVPRPIVPGIAGRVNANIAAACPDITLK